MDESAVGHVSVLDGSLVLALDVRSDSLSLELFKLLPWALISEY